MPVCQKPLALVLALALPVFPLPAAAATFGPDGPGDGASGAAVEAGGAKAPADVYLSATPTAIANPILFVTQVPLPGDFTSINAVFGNHQADLQNGNRGGDLWIYYPDGTLKNLTAAAGFGSAGQQGASSINVREPSVHWNGTKALFSMVVGAPTAQYQVKDYYWQIYEITGLGKTDTPVITKVANQPPDYNNVSPFYGTDERVLFTSDRPRNGQRHLWPQRDEYEEAPTVTGLWSLNPITGDLRMLNQSPSGVFSPGIDSYGRVIFTRWDHLQRDQQADADSDGDTYGTFNFADETAGAAKLNDRTEVFPEPRAARTDLLAGTNLEGHSFNDFFPWQINEDGTDEETLNHVGRHEFHSYFNRTMNDDTNQVEFIAATTGRVNQNSINNIIQLREDAAVPGRYIGIDAPEFSTHASGQVIAFSAPPSLAPDQITISYLTHRSTASYNEDNQAADPNHSGHYRNPIGLSDGTLVAVHTTETRADKNTGTRANPGSRYAFRLKTLKSTNGGTWVSDQTLTTGITKSISFWDPDVLVSYNGTLWELDPVEVKARTKPSAAAPGIAAPEQAIFTQESVDPAAFRTWLKGKGQAAIVSRNVTTRDKLDKQQPFNLKVAGSATQTLGAGGKIYQVAHMQLFQADQIRGIGGTADPRDGRRVLAQVMHEPGVTNPPNPTGPAGSVAIAADGSMAAFVPARRAMAWHLTDTAATPVVRERVWVTFQPGEVRLCTSCHGLSSKNQANQTAPTNSPEALRGLLQYWKTLQPPAIAAADPLVRQRGQSAVSTIASVADPQTAAGSLTVTTTSVPTGLTVSGIANTNGTVNATVAAACNATLGSLSVGLQVTDGTNPVTTTLGVIVTPDTTAPAVTPPAGISVDQSSCFTGTPGASLATLQPRYPAQFTAFAAFVAGGSAVEACGTPTRLAAQAGGTDLISSTFFPIGVTPVTFAYQDGSGNVGSATANVTVRRQGDGNLDGVVDIQDNIIYQSYLVGNIGAGVAPFNGTVSGADTDGNGTIDIFDIVRHQGFIVGNVPCLTP